MMKKLTVIISLIIVVLGGLYLLQTDYNTQEAEYEPAESVGAERTSGIQYFAHVTNGVVDSVIVINEETLIANGGWYCSECGEFRPIEEWVETSEGVTKNFAGKGYQYDASTNTFIPPKPYPSWTLDTETGRYVAPKTTPSRPKKPGEIDVWDEQNQRWEIKNQNAP